MEAHQVMTDREQQVYLVSAVTFVVLQFTQGPHFGNYHHVTNFLSYFTAMFQAP
jgi:hypothetical protein